MWGAQRGDTDPKMETCSGDRKRKPPFLGIRRACVIEEVSPLMSHQFFIGNLSANTFIIRIIR